MENTRSDTFSYVLDNINYVAFGYKTTINNINYLKVKRINLKKKVSTLMQM